MSDNLKVSGKNFPTPADPLTRVCFVMEIPDAIEYRAAVMGQVGWLADWRCWKHNQSDYSDPPPINREIAALFAEALSTARFEDCMSCEQIIACINDNPATRAALAAWFVAELATPGTLRDAVYNAAATAALDAGRYGYGENLSDTAMHANLGAGFNPTCDPNITWAQCLQLVQKTNRFIVDTIESAEVASDLGEFAIWVAELPFLNLIARNTFVTSALEAGEKLLEFTSEAYLAAYTEAKENEIACSLFCACVDDCEISVDRIFQVMHERVSQWGTFPTFGNLADWVSWFGGVAFSGGSIVDIIFFAAYGSLKVSNFLFFEPANYLLDTIIAVASDNPSADWETLCDVCKYTHKWNATNGWSGWDLLSWAGNPAPIITDGVVVGQSSSDGLSIFVYMGRTLPSNVDSVTVVYEYVRIDNASTNAIYLTNPSLSVVYGTNLLPPPSGDTSVATTTTPASSDFRILSGLDGQTATGQYLRIKEIRAVGEKPDPF